MIGKISLIFLLVALATAPGSNSFDLGARLKNIGSSISNAACVVSHMSEFNSCYDKIKDAYRELDYNDVGKDDKKEACCQYLAYRDCVEAVAFKYCGADATSTANSFMDAIKGASRQCDDYNSIFDCMDPIVLVAVCIVLAIVGIAILGCLIRICQSCCKC